MFVSEAILNINFTNELTNWVSCLLLFWEHVLESHIVAESSSSSFVFREMRANSHNLFFSLVVGMAHLKNLKSLLILLTQWACLYSWMLSIPMPRRMWWMASMNLMALTLVTSMEVPEECIPCGIPGSSTTQGTAWGSLH